MANAKISALPAATVLALEDLFAAVDDPSGTPATVKATVQQLLDTIGLLPTGTFTLADADVFAVNDQTDNTTKGVTLAELRTALEAGLLPDEGENWKIIRADSATATTNGTTLKTEYTTASAATPYGSPVDTDNPYYLILMPGLYDFGATGLVMDTNGVGLIGIAEPPNNNLLDGSSSTGSIGALQPSGAKLTSTDTTIDQTAASVRLENLTIETTVNNSTTEFAIAFPANNGSSVYRNCAFVSATGTNHRAMESGVSVQGFWENCWTADDYAFGGGDGSDAAGVFIRCYGGGSFCFGGAGGDASGIFVDCSCGNGWANFTTDGTDDASGLFINCTARATYLPGGSTAGSFGNRCTASGTFLNCRALSGNGSFGGSETSTATGTASGVFVNCYAPGDGGFGGNSQTSGDGNATGLFVGCVAGDDSYGWNDGTVTGTFIGCRGEDQCFGGDAVLNGVVVSCKAGNSSFGGGATDAECAGVVVACHGGTDCFGGAGGDCTNLIVACVGGNGSFAGNSGAGAGGNITGVVKGCYGFNGSFAGSVSGNGGTISGRCYECCGDASCFAGAGTGDTGGTISGKLFNCHAGEFSFAGSDAGTGGVISGEMFNCSNEEGAFADGTTPGTISGRLERCSILGEMAATLSGRMAFMDITATTANADGVQVADGATIAHCIIRGNGTGDSVGSAGAVTVSIFQSAFNSAFDANVTNDITTPFNVVDANV